MQHDMDKKSFIITVDTEGDNLWNFQAGDEITTRNAEYIPRFQALCDEFGFKPVYLTNFEMANSPVFVSEAGRWLRDERCEIGVHLHAWNNPPQHDLSGPYDGQPYLIEYPETVMRQKFQVIHSLLERQFGIKPVSHRAGRWAMNAAYFDLLREFGIRVDCSCTPFISWAASKGVTCGGSDYSHAAEHPSVIGGVLEVPMTVRRTRVPLTGSWKYRLKTLVKGSSVWLRPALESVAAMRWLMNRVHVEPVDYLEFMIHSSELMPGGSPYNETGHSVEIFFDKMRRVFEHAAELGYEGRTLAEYCAMRCEK